MLYLFILSFIFGVILGGVIIWLMRGADIKALRTRLDVQQTHSQQMLRQAEETLCSEQQRSRQQRADDERAWQAKLEAVKHELLNVTAQQIADNSRQLRQTNNQSLTELLRPLRQQFDEFKHAVESSRTQSEVSKQQIEDKFAETLKLFQLQQEHAIQRLQDETARIGNDAVALAEALKTNTKRQGNWGEMVLQTLLENSGLEEGAHFFVQYNVDDDEGNRQIPDVVVKFPDARSIVIDSKVSLTSYTQYFETEDEAERERLLVAHLRSVEKHVAELSAKHYERTVENSMDYVLMFIPNESSYIMALKLKPELLSQAYAKKVIIISPNNLMMALQLAYNMWQNDKQVKNIEEIIHRGQLLYEKVTGFQETFDSIGTAIDSLHRTFETARKQAFAGSGNILRQCELLREYGVPVKDKNPKLRK